MFQMADGQIRSGRPTAHEDEPSRSGHVRCVEGSVLIGDSDRLARVVDTVVVDVQEHRAVLHACHVSVTSAIVPSVHFCDSSLGFLLSTGW